MTFGSWWKTVQSQCFTSPVVSLLCTMALRVRSKPSNFWTTPVSSCAREAFSLERSPMPTTSCKYIEASSSATLAPWRSAHVCSAFQLLYLILCEVPVCHCDWLSSCQYLFDHQKKLTHCWPPMQWLMPSWKSPNFSWLWSLTACWKVLFTSKAMRSTLAPENMIFQHYEYWGVISKASAHCICSSQQTSSW